jgi:glycosyltransferase involved in cell wall biosynthesis
VVSVVSRRNALPTSWNPEMTFDDASLCEVRIPTFRRPKLLRRALQSLIDQTHHNWRSIVFDDCPNGSAQAVVEDIQDGRIGYARNAKQLGACGNIDKSFTQKPLLGGKYAFVLEDDNYLLPTHIERSIDILIRNGAKVAFCNQFCEIITAAEEPGQVGTAKTLDWMYEPGMRSPDELLPALLFSHGFSNGAVFWSTDCFSDFEIGASTRHPEIQESLRLLQLKDSVYVSLESTSVWRPREPEISSVWSKLTFPGLKRAAKNKVNVLDTEIEKIDYRSNALKRLGSDQVLRYVKNNAIPDFARYRNERLATIERSMLLSGYHVNLAGRRLAYRIGLLWLGLVVRNLSPFHLKKTA